PAGLAKLQLLQGGVTAQLAGVVLALVSILLFSLFTSSVRRNLRADDAGRPVTAYLWYAAFLFSGTVGLAMIPRSSPRGTWTVLAWAWLGCLLWHTLLLLGTARHITRELNRPKSRLVPKTLERVQIAMQTEA